MVAWAPGSWLRGRSLLTFIAAKRAVFLSLTGAGLMTAVFWIVNGWLRLWFHVAAPYGEALVQILHKLRAASSREDG